MIGNAVAGAPGPVWRGVVAGQDRTGAWALRSRGLQLQMVELGCGRDPSFFSVLGLCRESAAAGRTCLSLDCSQTQFPSL